MPAFVIDCDAAVSAEQYAELGRDLPRDQVDVLHQMAAADRDAIGMATLVLAFPNKTVFYAYLSEPGRDDLSWRKFKGNIIRARKIKALNVEYRIYVGEVLFVDDEQGWDVRRHEMVLGAVDAVYRQIQAEKLWNARCVKLVFDAARGDYTEARMFSCEYEQLETAGIDYGLLEGLRL
jgi:hypothetical protein